MQCVFPFVAYFNHSFQVGINCIALPPVLAIITGCTESICNSKFTCSRGRPYHKQCQRQSQSGPFWWHTAFLSTASTPANSPSPWTPWPGRSCSSQCPPSPPRSRGPAVVRGSRVARTFENVESAAKAPSHREKYSRHDFRLAEKVLGSGRWVFDQLLHSHLLPPII